MVGTEGTCQVGSPMQPVGSHPRASDTWEPQKEWVRAMKMGHPFISSNSALLVPFISLSPGSRWVAEKSGAAFLVDRQTKPCSQKERGGWLGLSGFPPLVPAFGCRHLSHSAQPAPYILRGSKGAAKSLWPQLRALCTGEVDSRNDRVTVRQGLLEWLPPPSLQLAGKAAWKGSQVGR